MGEIECAIGTYQPNTGQSSCLYCPSGKLCDALGMENPNDCPIGSYCPAKTSSVTNEAILCPAGTYSAKLNIGSSADCTPCIIGSYCVAGSTSASDAI